MMPNELCTLLPPHAAQELYNASKLLDEFERIKSIDSISDRLRAAYPLLFRRDGVEADRDQR